MDAYQIAQMMGGQTSGASVKYGTVTEVSSGTYKVIPDGAKTAITAVACCAAQVDSRVVLMVVGTEFLAIARIGASPVWSPLNIVGANLTNLSSFVNDSTINREVGLIQLKFEISLTQITTISANTCLATLPVGVRPASTISLRNIGRRVSDVYNDFTLRINSSGQLLTPTWGFDAQYINVPGLSVPLSTLGL